jgi:putative membrane protein
MNVNAVAALAVLANDNGDWGHHWWWPLWLLFWAALIGGVVWLILRRRNRGSGPLDRAREILAERFARGELTGDEYRARLDELHRHTDEARAAR